MNPEMIFLTAVLGIAGIHLLFKLVKFITKHQKTGVKESSKERERQDWYVFFEKSALYGDKASTAKKPNGVSEDADSNLTYEDAHQLQESFT